MEIGIGLEVARGARSSFEYAAKRAVEIGFRHIEPYVYSPVTIELNSHLGWSTYSDYYHLNADEVEVPEMRALLTGLGVELSALDAHSTLLAPHVGVPYLVRAIDIAADFGCPIVMSDEGPVSAEWHNLDRAFDVMCYSIEQIVLHAQSRRVRFAIELHNALTTRVTYLRKLMTRFSADELGINFDTGNAFLAGNEPAEMLSQIVDRVIHVHIKDIPEEQLHLRGLVTGTRVGVAAGDGVVDLPSVLSVLAEGGYNGVLSIECDNWDQAHRSRLYLEEQLKSLRQRQRESKPPGAFLIAQVDDE